MRILVFGLTSNLGGIETFMLTYVKEIVKMGDKFDFLATCEQLAVESELLELGCRVYHITPKRKSFFRYRKELSYFMKVHANEYDVVWLNDVLFCNIDVLKYGKKYGIPKRILHAHNSQALGSKSRIIRHNIIKHFVKYYATDFWACSDLAAKWSFEKSDYLRSVVITNAIDTSIYKFDASVRSRVRRELDINDEYIIGNIGRMDYQKNQLFLLNIFKKITEIDNNCLLLIIGTGADEKKLKKVTSDLQIEDKVRFLGIRKDVPALLQAMDVFVLPSKFEGLGIVAIEAEAAGLPCVFSDTIPEITNLTPANEYISLDDDPSRWVNAILKYQNRTREEFSSYVIQGGFDIRNEAIKVRNLLG